MARTRFSRGAEPGATAVVAARVRAAAALGDSDNPNRRPRVARIPVQRATTRVSCRATPALRPAADAHAPQQATCGASLRFRRNVRCRDSARGFQFSERRRACHAARRPHCALPPTHTRPNTCRELAVATEGSLSRLHARIQFSERRRACHAAQHPHPRRLLGRVCVGGGAHSIVRRARVASSRFRRTVRCCDSARRFQFSERRRAYSRIEARLPRAVAPVSGGLFSLANVETPGFSPKSLLSNPAHNSLQAASS